MKSDCGTITVSNNVLILDPKTGAMLAGFFN